MIHYFNPGEKILSLSTVVLEFLHTSGSWFYSTNGYQSDINEFLNLLSNNWIFQVAEDQTDEKKRSFIIIQFFTQKVTESDTEDGKLTRLAPEGPSAFAQGSCAWLGHS